MSDQPNVTIAHPEATAETAETFEAILAKMPADLQAKFSEHTAGLKTALDKEREAAKTNAQALKKLAALEAAEQKRADEQMTREQKLEKELADARATAETATVQAEAKLLRAAILLKAKDMDFEHPEDAFALADKSAIARKGDDFDPASIEAALKPLVGRLPTKSKGAGIGTPSLTGTKPAPQKQKPVAQKFTRY